MNFKNIQNLFICVFVLLNLFLFSIYRENRVKFDTLTNQVKSNIGYRLEKDEIKTIDLSSEHQKGFYLSAKKSERLIDFYRAAENKKNIQEVGNEVIVVPSTNFSLEKQFTAQKLHQLINEKLSINHFQEYSYLKFMSVYHKKTGQAIFAQTYEKMPFLDTDSLLTFDFQFSNNTYQLTAFSQNYLTNIRPLREAHELISEKEAIISLYNQSKIPEQSKINMIKLGYTKIIEIKDESVYIPTWWVEIRLNKTSKIEKVNAVNGTIITETSVTKIDN